MPHPSPHKQAARRDKGFVQISGAFLNLTLLGAALPYGEHQSCIGGPQFSETPVSEMPEARSYEVVDWFRV